MGDYNLTLGPVLLGVMLNALLYGIVMIQFVRYFQASHKIDESRTFRILFISVLLMDTAYTASTMYLVWSSAVTHRDDPAAAIMAVWPLEVSPLALAWPAFVTQLYLIRRLWRLISSKLLIIVCTSLATCSFLLSVSVTASFFITNVYTGAPFTTFYALMTTSLVTLFVADCFITGSLSIALLRARTGVKKVDHVIYRFMRGALQTGVFAGITSLGGVLSFLCATNTSLDLFFGIPLGRVYTATLLYSLLLRVDSAAREANICQHQYTHNTRSVQLTSAIRLDEPTIDKEHKTDHARSHFPSTPEITEV